MEGNYSLSDISAAMNGGGFGGANSWVLIILFALIFGNGGLFGGRGDYGTYATAASQQEILYGQHFQNLDNKLDRLGFGISDATYALNNTIINEGRSMTDKLCALNTAVHEEGEATRAMIQQNKIETLQAQVNELKTSQMFCGIPRINPYGYSVVPTFGGCGCGNV